MKFSFKGDIKELEFGIKEIAAHLGVSLSEDGYEINVKKAESKSFTVSFNGGKGEIVYGAPCHFFRAFGILVESLTEGETEFEITQTQQFDTNGPMFDISQGGAVFNMPTAKSIIRQLALMGLNILMMYCEDSYEVKEQPYFGYMRSKYTEEEMHELDEYAYKLGIEMIPCIQTLAHLPDLLRWEVFRPIKDYRECLLVGKEETYAFLRDIITAASRPFRTNKIHIGMDEAAKLGRGNFIDHFGYKDPQEIMAYHLKRVNEIVLELGLRPMMWDDMFFRAAYDGAYYKKGAQIPQEVIDTVPGNMRCVYWDYYSLTSEKYEERVLDHQRLCKNMIFAGGVWTWVGYSLSLSKTIKTTELALDVCKKLGVRDVFMTTWGDNGTECLANTTLIGCQLFAEHGYADKIDYEYFKKRFKFCTGGNYDDFANLELLDKNPQNASLPDPSEYNASKYLMWQDVLTGLCDYNIDGYPLDAHYAELSKTLAEAAHRNGQFDGMFEFSSKVAYALAKKSEMGLRITKAYKAGDRAALENFAKVELPDLKSRFETLRKCHFDNWFALYKGLGWDIMDMRYGSLIARIDSAAAELEMYLDGRLERLVELEQKRLPFNGIEGPIKYLNYFGRIVSASRIAPRC
ncbi:MAG: beta-N-acetylhexosaminidase [Clostridia bacterium]|nr:beta-N-acetylhexosaminidase [Clostridia bacterium]